MMIGKEAKPPEFVMWRSVSSEQQDWQRQWFGDELSPSSAFNVRGLGIREPMFNANVHRPIGTGDWLIMYFHMPARLSPSNPQPSVKANTLILWPPGAEQFYSWGETADVEPHSWMHVEGMWVAQQVEEHNLPVAIPIEIEQESLMTETLRDLMEEMNANASPDPVILQNLFQNWIRRIARHIQPNHQSQQVPPNLLQVRDFLDAHFAESTPLDELAQMARMSRSHLCHQFRKHFGTTISKYVIRRRMSVAQRMLFEINLRPGDIAKAVGYTDIFQFSKQFKKSFGLSPTKYRKQHFNGNPLSSP